MKIKKRIKTLEGVVRTQGSALYAVNTDIRTIADNVLRAKTFHDDVDQAQYEMVVNKLAELENRIETMEKN